MAGAFSMRDLDNPHRNPFIVSDARGRMDDLDRPNLGPETDEEITVALYEVHETYWAQLRAMQIGPRVAFFEAHPVPPKRPIQLSAILRGYAQKLFSTEEIEYPQHPQLQHWRLKLAERVSNKVMESVREIEDRGMLSSLKYHGLTESRMREIVDEALREIALANLPQITKQENQPAEELALDETSHEDKETIISPASNENEIERRKKLLAEYKAATHDPSDRKIYEAQNSGIHKPQFYEWRNGKLLSNSITAKKFEAFLKAKKPPVPKK
jgi:hypothetical protein